MIKSVYYLMIFLSLLGCGGEKRKAMLLSAEEMVSQYPDSIYRLLSKMDINMLSCNKEKADFALVYTESQYKSRRPVNSDSLIRIAWEYYSGEEDDLKAAKAEFYMGKVYCGMDSIEKATYHVLCAASHALKVPDNKLLGLIESELGKLYQKQLMVEQSLEHYRKSQIYFQQASDSSNENYATGNIARCFLVNNQIDSAICYYSEARNGAIVRNDKDYLIYLNKDLIQLYVRIGKTQFAKDLSIENYAVDSNKYQYYYNLSDCAYFENKFDSARYNIEALLNDTMLNLSLSQQVLANLRLHLIEAKAGNYKEAYEQALQYGDLSDSLQKKNYEDNILQAEVKYEKEQLLNQNYALQIKNYRSIFIHAVLIFILVFIVFYHRKVVKRKQCTIHEYRIMIEALKEEYETSQNSLLGKLNEKEKREQELKAKFLKRLQGVKGIADLLSQCAENEDGYKTFYKSNSSLNKHLNT